MSRTTAYFARITGGILIPVGLLAGLHGMENASPGGGWTFFLCMVFAPVLFCLADITDAVAGPKDTAPTAACESCGKRQPAHRMHRIGSGHLLCDECYAQMAGTDKPPKK